MTKLENMINELCPDGVKYAKLSDIASYSKIRISADKLNKSNYISVENLLPDKAGKINAKAVPKECNFIYYPFDTILIGNIRPYLRKIWISDCEGGTNGDVLPVVIKDKNKIIPKFLFYVLSSENFFYYDIQHSKGTKMPRGDKTAIMNFYVPIPPLDVQREIVRILDSFTEYKSLLKKEIDLRKKQYLYYRDMLMTFGKGIQKIYLENLCIIGDGLHGTPAYDDLGEYRFINGIIEISNTTKRVNKEVFENNRKSLNNNTVLMSINGTIGNIAFYNNEKIILGKSVAYFTITNKTLNKSFLYYYLQTSTAMDYYENNKTGSTIKNLGLKALRNFKIPVPPIEEQKRIVSILDIFSKYCVLRKKELKLREKQYEYYRDKILTFKEA